MNRKKARIIILILAIVAVMACVYYAFFWNFNYFAELFVESAVESNYEMRVERYQQSPEVASGYGAGNAMGAIIAYIFLRGVLTLISAVLVVAFCKLIDHIFLIKRPT